MRRILKIYKTGERYLLDGMILGIHGGEVIKEYDLDKATEKEFEEIRKNLHNDLLLEEIAKRS